MQKGIVKKWESNSGWGFIEGDDNEDYFFNISSVRKGQKMRIAITGATGLIGSALRPFLESGGHTVVPLRRTNGESVVVPSWNPTSGSFS